VIMSAVAPGSVFTFLLNSSGAIVLFVYLLIALSQIVLRYKTPPEKLRVKMWFFPVLSILTLLAIVGVLVQMAFNSTVRVQFWLSLLSWAAVVVVYFLARRWRRPVAGA
jgi:GABA permease